MKSILKSSILAGMATLCMLFSQYKESSLKDIAKPHLGVYHCTQAKLGDKDLLADFSRIEIELREGEYTLVYQEKEGEIKKVDGKYTYDSKRKVFVLFASNGGIKREIPYAEGKMTLTFPAGKKECVLQFERK